MSLHLLYTQRKLLDLFVRHEVVQLELEPADQFRATSKYSKFNRAEKYTRISSNKRYVSPLEATPALVKIRYTEFKLT